MQTVIGLVVCVVMAALYAAQLVSALDFALAQRLGLQERAAGTDPLFGRLERNTARWDLLWFWTAPVAGLLMLLDHAWWPYAGLVGGGMLVDAGGREAAKLLGLRAHGVRTGTRGERRLALGFLAFLVAAGLALIAMSLAEVA